jgi:hypothetical protein
MFLWPRVADAPLLWQIMLDSPWDIIRTSCVCQKFRGGDYSELGLL